jgi:hypothetical protein
MGNHACVVRCEPAPHFLILLFLGTVVGTIMEVMRSRLMVGVSSQGSELPRAGRQIIVKEITESE